MLKTKTESSLQSHHLKDDIVELKDLLRQETHHRQQHDRHVHF